MHKTLAILLSVCLVSVLAGITKRDTEQNENVLEKIQKTAEEFGKKVSDQLSEVLNPDNIKDGFNKFVDTVQNAANSLKKEEEPKQ
ncbi:unnamed protein product [Colias eurytheme]|nr:unnamed protein product [Colias eurytheme]